MSIVIQITTVQKDLHPFDFQNKARSPLSSIVRFHVYHPYHHGQARVHLHQKGDTTTGSCKQSNINLALCRLINCSLLFSNLIMPSPFQPYGRISRRAHANHRPANCTPRSREITVNRLVYVHDKACSPSQALSGHCGKATRWLGGGVKSN
jgi:hypothetical protein